MTDGTDINGSVNTGDTRILIRPDLAMDYVREIAERWTDPGVLFIDPAAGMGAFAAPLATEFRRRVRAIDTDPRGGRIKALDFLRVPAIFGGDHSATAVVGSPPFGRNAGAIVRYFNHAAEHGADGIAFIVPQSFRKTSVRKRLHAMFHRQVDRNVPRRAFLRDGRPHDVDCAWQVWTRGDTERVTEEPPNVDHLLEYTTPDRAEFAIRRAGYNAGQVLTGDMSKLSRGTTHFVREVRPGVREALENADWSDVVGRTSSVRSLSKGEIAFRLDGIFG